MANDMNIVPPVVGTTAGPAWANQINTILTTTISDHNHEAGKGTPLSQDAIVVDGTFNLNNNTLGTTKNVQLSSQVTAPSQVQSVYALGGNLYYKNSAGANVQITNGSTLAANSVSGIQGLAGSDGGASYSSGQFIWTSNFGASKAAMQVGNVRIYDSAGAGLNYVNVVQPNVIAGNKQLTLPAQNITLPQTIPTAGEGLRPLVINSNGVFSYGGANASSTIFNATWTNGGTQGAIFTIPNCTGRPIMVTIGPTDVSSPSIGQGNIELKPINLAAANDPLLGYYQIKYTNGATTKINTTYIADFIPYAAGSASAFKWLSPYATWIFQPDAGDTNVSIELIGYQGNNKTELKWIGCTISAREI